MRIQNRVTSERCTTTSLHVAVAQRRLGLAGHILRMSQHRIPRESKVKCSPKTDSSGVCRPMCPTAQEELSPRFPTSDMDEQDLHHYYGGDGDDIGVIYQEEVVEYTPNFSPEPQTPRNDSPVTSSIENPAFSWAMAETHKLSDPIVGMSMRAHKKNLGPRKIAAPLVEEEVRLIMERYIENYETYHHNLSGGCRQGFPKTEAAKTGGGIAKLPRLTNVQKFVHEALESKPRAGGIAGGQECDDFANEHVIENEKENKPPRKKVKPVDVSEEKNCNLRTKEDLLAGEIRVINLKLENLRKERELLEIKLDYWKRKASV
ncbi:hypothetical protein ANCDUO_11306 [Ancylostoma duodenale]|uniref:Uncharacterized protein n=1 Tax=Ancylostoma duodenale TaxID=51022 RepID=A0A0C2GNC3_9BILA|nr:hypothetical protein ANCDUO_11306 [Ancylostoma duodenale]